MSMQSRETRRMLRDGECRFEIKIEGELPVLVAGEATAASGDTAVAVAGVAMAAMVVTLSALAPKPPVHS